MIMIQSTYMQHTCARCRLIIGTNRVLVLQTQVGGALSPQPREAEAFG